MSGWEIICLFLWHEYETEALHSSILSWIIRQFKLLIKVGLSLSMVYILISILYFYLTWIIEGGTSKKGKVEYVKALLCAMIKLIPVNKNMFIVKKKASKF